MWYEAQAKALRSVFQKFDQNDIKWMVFRNYRGLPDENPSKDVDLLIERKSIKKAQKIMEKTLSELGYSRKTFERFQCIWCYSFFKEELGHSDSIKIDLFYGLVWRGVPTVTFEDIYNSAVLYNGFKVPNPIMDSFLLWIKPVMTGGFVKERYVDDILKNADKPEFQTLIKNTFNEKLYDKTLGCFTTAKIKTTGQFQKEMCRISWCKGFLKNPLDAICSTTTHFVLEIIRRTRNPKETFICVLGPDGVGKTTVIEKLKEKAQDVFIRDAEKMKVEHFRPNVLPNLKKLMHPSLDMSKEKFEEPHRGKQANQVSSFFRMLYYWLDYWLGWGSIQQKCVHGNIMIFDRYSYDFFVDPRRCCINLPDNMRKHFALSVPQPNIVFVLTADADIIRNRKQELDIDEITRQLLEYNKLESWNKKFVLVDASKTVDEITDYMIQKWVEILQDNT